MAQDLNINTAGIDDLIKTGQIGHEAAGSLLGYRASHGRFERWEDLLRVEGISKGTVELLKRQGFRLDGLGPVERENIEIAKRTYSRGGEGRMGGEDIGE